MTEDRPLHLRDVESGGVRLDVTVSAGVVVAIGPDLAVPATALVVDGGGGALLPGLHGHHIHIAALGARARSVDVGPPAVRSREELLAALAAADATNPTAGSGTGCRPASRPISGPSAGASPATASPPSQTPPRPTVPKTWSSWRARSAAAISPSPSE